MRTKEIELTPSKYFQLLVRMRFESSWYVYALPFVFSGVWWLLFPEQGFTAFAILIFAIVYPLWIVVYLYIHSTSDKTAYIGIKRYYEFDGDQINGFHKDGSESAFNLSDITAVRQMKNAYLLYFSRSEFIYLPKDALDGKDMETLMGQLKALNVRVK